MKKIVLILTILFSFNIYSQDSKPIKIDKSYFTDNGNLKEDSDLKINVIRKIRFKDNSVYEIIILKNKYWYYYTLFKIEQNNKYKYIGTIPLKSFNMNIEGLVSNIVYKDNYFTIEHNFMESTKMYITFKYNDDKKIYLDKTSMIVEFISNTDDEKTTKQVDGKVTPNKILYEDVTSDMVFELLNISTK